ncbi:AAA family ATPase [Thermodesulfobacteriota bacterium]
MKFERLNLIKFGSYTDRSIVFQNENDADFHLLYGPNEAGKTTTLRAIRYFLYGFPKTVLDDYIHKQKDLRIGATVHGNEGDKFTVIRRKGLKNTLLNSKEQSVDESILTVELHGINEDIFQTLFGLSHEGLVEGGKMLLAGQGEMGESLFGAGTGIRNIHDLRLSLKAEAENIFTPLGSTKPLNKELKNFKDAKTKTKRLALKPREFLDLSKELEEKEHLLKENDLIRAKLITEKSQKERIVRTAPQVVKRANLIKQKEKLGDVPRVPEKCTQDRIDAQKVIDTTESKLEVLFKNKKSKKERLDKIHVPVNLLSRSEEIGEIQDKLPVNRQAMNDLPKLEADRKSSMKDAENFLRELGKATLSEVKAIPVDVSVTEPIKSLTLEFHQLKIKITAAEENLETAKSEREDLEKETDLGTGADPTSLAKIIGRIRKRGDLEAQVAEKMLQREASSDDAKKAIAPMLPEAVIAVSPPLEETARIFDEKFNVVTNKKEPYIIDQEKLEIEISEAGIRLEEIFSKEGFFTDADLAEAREKRDQLWSNLKISWEEGMPLSGENVIAEVEKFETTSEESDRIADVLKDNAALVAEHASLTFTKDRDTRRCNAAAEKIKKIEDEITELNREWTAFLFPLGLNYSPREYLAWLVKYDKFSDIMSDIKGIERDVKILRKDIADYKNELVFALTELKANSIPEKGGLSVLLDYAEEFADQIIEQNSLSSQLQKEKKKAEKTVTDKDSALKKLTAAMGKWKIQWAAAVKPLKILGTPSVEVIAKTLELTNKIFEKINDADKTEIRIKEITDFSEALKNQVTALANDCAPDCILPDFIDTAQKLIVSRDKGREAKKEEDDFEAEIKIIEGDIEKFTDGQTSAKDTIERLLGATGCKTVEDLIRLEEKFAKHQDLSADIDEIEENLLTEGMPIEELVRQVGENDLDSLPSDIESLANKLKDLEKTINELRTAIGGLGIQKGQMGGGREAADAAFEAQEALAMITKHADHYALLRLAFFVLEEEIEKFREKNQGPIMERAKEIFTRITGGAYIDLTSRFDADDKLVLVAVKKDHSTVTVAGLSDGTRDQLFLSLRIAGIERHIENNAPLPLIVDDILINFDDDRAKATLEVLGEVSAITQVLFFTHHTRLQELAKEVIPAGRMNEHVLGIE